MLFVVVVGCCAGCADVDVVVQASFHVDAVVQGNVCVHVFTLL
jgi:hypothetical protein